jgi:hypothetical protein
MALAWRWANGTPAGADAICAVSVPSFRHLLRPELIFVAGDVALAGMHDGNHFPLGAESPFLATLDARFRYDRAPSPEVANELRSDALLYLLVERLVEGAAVEAKHPKVAAAELETDGRKFRATASLDPAPAGTLVSLWWNHSPDRVYNRPWSADAGAYQTPPWQQVTMSAGGGGSYQSAWVTTLPDGEELAWYVEAAAPFSVGPNSYARKDASPVRFAFRVPEKSCPGLAVPAWCP